MSAILIFLLKLVFLASLYFFLYQLVRTAQSDLSGQKSTAQKIQQQIQETIETTQELEIRPDLVVEQSDLIPVGKRYHLIGGLTIGRAKSSDIVLSDPYVSSAHARIYKLGGEYFIEDLGSTNGTYLNDLKVGQSTPLKDGYELVIGNNRFRFEE